MTPPLPDTARGRQFTLVQRSYWVSDGWDPGAASYAESTLVAADSAAAIDSLVSQRYGSLPLTLTSWLSLARRGRAVSQGDTLQYRYAIGGDTIVARWTRAPRTTDTPQTGREGWFPLASTTWLTIEARSTIEQWIDAPGVRVHTEVSGSLEEHLLYDPATGQVDSVHARGTLRGRRIFVQPNGRADTIRGRWVVAQDACWFSPPDSSAAIWIGESGYPDALCPAPGEARRAFWPLAARAAQGDTTALDSLFAQRRRETDPLRRAPAALLDLSEADPGAFVRRAIAAYRPGDADLLSRLTWRVAFFVRRGGDDSGLAALLARELRDLRHERATGIDREEVLSNLWYAFRSGAPVSLGVAGTLAGAAAQTDDPRARDIFLLAAYRAAPDRYAAEVDRLADRAGWAWGYARGEVPPQDSTAFPGRAAPWQAHRRYLAGPYREDRLGALRAWFVARQADPIKAFRGRFVSEADTAGRFVWARYLLALGDTAPSAWLVQLAESDRPPRAPWTIPGFPGDSLAGSAFGLLWQYRATVADTIRDPAMLTGAQVRVLECDGSATSDREPELLLDSRVTAEARARCGQRFRVVSGDSLQRLADRHGRAWATVVSPLLRIGHRYVIEVTREYWTRRNETCLCGGGHRYLLQYRAGRWSAVLIASWVI